MDDNKPFEKLKKVKIAPKQAKPAPQPRQAKPAPAPEAEQDEGTLFSSAMGGVQPIKGRSGRDLAKAPPPAPETLQPAGEQTADDDATEQLRRLVAGEVEFDLEFTDEFLQGHVRGLDERTLRQLMAGALSVEAHLDLHGCNAEQAMDSVLFFVRESYLMGRRVVLIVTGRGLNSPGGMGVLRQETQTWLTRDPLKRVVLAFCTAQPRHGGAGAIYVLLRKRKKSEGKVKFDRNSFWGD